MDNSCAFLHLICSQYLLPEISCWLLTIHVIGRLHHLHFLYLCSLFAEVYGCNFYWLCAVDVQNKFGNLLTYHALLHYISDSVCYGDESDLLTCLCSTKCHMTYSLSSHTLVVLLWGINDGFDGRNLISLSAIKWDSSGWDVFMQRLAHMGPKSQCLCLKKPFKCS